LIRLGFDRDAGLAEQRSDVIAAFAGEFGDERAVGRQIHAAELPMEHPEHTEKDFCFRNSVCSVLSVGNLWVEQTIYFVDFEGSRESGILEYGVVTLRGAVIIEAHTRLCGAIGRVRPEDSAVHGLHAEALVNRQAFSADWEFFAGLRECGPLAAHYAGVENGLLKSVWPYPRSSPDFARPGECVVDWGPWVDTAPLYAQFYPQLKSGQLEALIGAMGLQAELEQVANRFCPVDRCRYHAALYDALAGALLLRSLARDPQIAALSTMQLLALSTLDPEKRAALQQRELF
jgi:DNA polymerase III epsilon subunit-like protein